MSHKKRNSPEQLGLNTSQYIFHYLFSFKNCDFYFIFRKDLLDIHFEEAATYCSTYMEIGFIHDYFVSLSVYNIRLFDMEATKKFTNIFLNLKLDLPIQKIIDQWIDETISQPNINISF